MICTPLERLLVNIIYTVIRNVIKLNYKMSGLDKQLRIICFKN